MFSLVSLVLLGDSAPKPLGPAAFLKRSAGFLRASGFQLSKDRYKRHIRDLKEQKPPKKAGIAA